MDESSRLCKLHRYPFQADELVPEAGSPRIFYDLSCFDCSYCPHPIGKNIIDNGNFEYSNKHLGPWLSYRGLPGKGHNSSTSFYCPPSQDSGCSLYQGRNSCPGTLYLLQFDYQIVTQPGTSGRISHRDYEAALDTKQDDSIYIDTASFHEEGWYTIRRYTRNSGSAFDLYGSAEAWVDNVVQIPVLPLHPVPGAVSLFVNGDFEHQTPALQGWDFRIIAGSVGIISPGLDGSSHALRVSVTPHHHGTPYEQFSFAMRQRVRTIPGRAYLLRFSLMQLETTYIDF